MPAPPYSSHFSFARYAAALATDWDRLRRFLRSPQTEAEAAGLDSREVRLLLKGSALQLFLYTAARYHGVFVGTRPNPYEHPGDD